MITKNNLISDVSKNTKVPKYICSKVINECIDQIERYVLSGDKVVLPGLLSIEMVKYPARMGRDPVTGEVIKYPPSKSVKCKPSKQLKELVKRK